MFVLPDFKGPISILGHSWHASWYMPLLLNGSKTKVLHFKLFLIEVIALEALVFHVTLSRLGTAFHLISHCSISCYFIPLSNNIPPNMQFSSQVTSSLSNKQPST
jgi:hypothetical protein